MKRKRKLELHSNHSFMQNVQFDLQNILFAFYLPLEIRWECIKCQWKVSKVHPFVIRLHDITYNVMLHDITYNVIT